MLDLKTPFIFSLVVLSVGAAAQSDESSLQGAHDELEHIEVKRHFQPYRGNVPLIDTPQAIDRITADTLANEGITRFIDALDFAPTLSDKTTLAACSIVLRFEVFLAMKITHRVI